MCLFNLVLKWFLHYAEYLLCSEKKSTPLQNHQKRSGDNILASIFIVG